MDWDRLRYSDREPAGEVTAKGDRGAVVERDDREAANERGDRVAVNAVAIEYLDTENRSFAPVQLGPLRTGGYRVSLGRSPVQSRACDKRLTSSSNGG